MPPKRKKPTKKPKAKKPKKPVHRKPKKTKPRKPVKRKAPKRKAPKRRARPTRPTVQPVPIPFVPSAPPLQPHFEQPMPIPSAPHFEPSDPAFTFRPAAYAQTIPKPPQAPKPKPKKTVHFDPESKYVEPSAQHEVKEKTTTKLKPIAFPWQPYLNKFVQARNIDDPASPVWNETFAPRQQLIAQLSRDEQRMFRPDDRKQARLDPIPSYPLQLGNELIHIYDGKHYLKWFREHIFRDLFMPFTSAIAMAHATAQAERNPVSANSLLSILHAFPMADIVVDFLDVIINAIIENGAHGTFVREFVMGLRDLPPQEILLRLYEKWFAPVLVESRHKAYSSSALHFLLTALKKIYPQHKPAWDELQNRIK